MYGDRDQLYEGGVMSTWCGSHFNRQDDRPNDKMNRYTYSKTHGPQRLVGIEAKTRSEGRKDDRGKEEGVERRVERQ